MMISVCFVCLGNICRSPMAELIFTEMVKERGLASRFNISSFGTDDCEVGNPIYGAALRELKEHGITGAHRAQQLSLRDVINNDYILVMDTANLNDVLRLTGGRFCEKIHRLCSFTDRPRDVSDPWYTRNFEKAYEDIYEGCLCFLNKLLSDKRAALGGTRL